jgi:polyvinyl alcohol dehydrogenase (cytochrome)
MGNNANCPSENGPDLDFGAPPILTTRSDGSSILLAGQKASVVHALDPDDGSLLWKRRLSPGNSGGGIHWGMAVDAGRLYAPINDQEAYMFSGEVGRPGLDALDIENGKTLWTVAAPKTCTEDDPAGCDRGYSAAVTAIPGVVFAGSIDGHLRAYAAEDGELLWEVDTARDYETVSGEVARGGSIESDGPVVYNGLVLINSGYTLGLMPGNLLLAFEVPDPS